MATGRSFSVFCVRNAIAAATAMILMVFIAGCQPKWNLSVVSVGDPERPEFCLSQSPDCEGSDAPLTFITIRSVNNLGEEAKKMWTIESSDKTGIRYLTYGSLPEGWHEIHPAQPLQFDVFYSINGTYFFRLTNKNYPDCEIFNEKEYNKIMLSLSN